jgi:hypothetical protein
MINIVILSVNEQNAKFIKSCLRYKLATVYIVNSVSQIMKLPKIHLLIEGDRWYSHPKAEEIEALAKEKLV